MCSFFTVCDKHNSQAHTFLFFVRIQQIKFWRENTWCEFSFFFSSFSFFYSSLKSGSAELSTFQNDSKENFDFWLTLNMFYCRLQIPDFSRLFQIRFHDRPLSVVLYSHLIFTSRIPLRSSSWTELSRGKIIKMSQRNLKQLKNKIKTIKRNKTKTTSCKKCTFRFSILSL